jgi:hypothetical protein
VLSKFAECTYPPFLSLFLRERDFFVAICSLLALARLILPDGLTLKRFAAARFVLTFGILKAPI